MPNKSKEDPTVKAAFINRKGAIIAALFTLTGVVIAATINAGWWSNSSKRFVVLVKDKSRSSENNLYRAKVSINGEGSGVGQSEFTDKEGRVTFNLTDAKKELRIFVEREGFESDDQRIIPADINLIKEFLLTPVKKEALAQSVPSLTPTPSAKPQTLSKENITSYISKCRSLFSSRKYEAALSQCDKALKIDHANQEASQLKKQIENTVKILNQ